MYDPKEWRSTDKIKDRIYVNHGYRVVASGRGAATLVDDKVKTVHSMQLDGAPFTKVWYLKILKRLDEGEKPEQTEQSKSYPKEAYRRYAR